MLPIIIMEIVVRSETIIHIDEWNKPDETDNYVHGTLNHRYNFEDVVTWIHTQHVKSLIYKIKSEIKAQRDVRKKTDQNF